MTASAKDNIDFDSGDMPFIQIKTSTWYKESYGMYDYFDPPEVTQKLSVVHAFHLYRKEEEDRLYISPKLNKTDTLILQGIYKDGNYFIGATK